MSTILIVPGLRDHVEEHWQTLLAADLKASGQKVHTVAPMGRTEIDCAGRVAAIERDAQAIGEPFIIVAHSAGCLMVAHWAQKTRCKVQGALLAVPPDFARPMPEGYPTMAELREAGWLPVPQERLPFPSIVAASHDDPLASFGRVAELAHSWGSRLVDVGHVGHLNPASGFGYWPRAGFFIAELADS